MASEKESCEETFHSHAYSLCAHVAPGYKGGGCIYQK